MIFSISHIHFCLRFRNKACRTRNSAKFRSLRTTEKRVWYVCPFVVIAHHSWLRSYIGTVVKGGIDFPSAFSHVFMDVVVQFMEEHVSSDTVTGHFAALFFLYFIYISQFIGIIIFFLLRIFSLMFLYI